MAQIATTFSAYDAIGIREDLSDVIALIDPTKTPVLTAIGTGEPAAAKTVEWQTQALASAAQNHQIEGDDLATYTAVTATARIGNYLSISRKEFLISETEQAVKKAGRASESGFQLELKLAELKRDMETNITANNAAVAGNDTTASETGGLGAMIGTNVSMGAGGANPSWTSGQPTTARTDGTQRAFTESLLQAAHQLCAENGAEPSMLLTGAFNKRIVSGFPGIAGQRFMASGQQQSTIVAAADVYLGDFGTLQVTFDLFQRSRDAWLLDPNKARVRYLRPTKVTPMAKTGDADKWLIRNEYALMVDTEKAHGLVADLTTS